MKSVLCRCALYSRFRVRPPALLLTCGLLVALLLLGHTVRAEAPPPTTTSAPPEETQDPCLTDAACRALVSSARTLSAERGYEAAYLAYTAAYARRPAPWLLFNIGRMQQYMGLYAQALQSYRAVLMTASSPGEEDLRRRAREFLRQTEEDGTENNKKARDLPPEEPGAGSPDEPQGLMAPVLPKGRPLTPPRALRAARPTWRLVLGGVLTVGGVGLVSSGSTLLGFGSRCYLDSQPPVLCLAEPSTVGVDVSLLVLGAASLVTGGVLVGLPGRPLRPPAAERPPEILGPETVSTATQPARWSSGL
jgi:hypothetical protein